MEFNGKKVNQLEDWKTSISEDFKAGDYVAADIVIQLLEALPPAYFSNGIFQCGEAYSHKEKNGRYKPTYLTFKRVYADKSDCYSDIYEYLGDRFIGGEE